MKTIDKVYIDGAFVTPKGKQMFDLINPSTNLLEAQVVLGNEEDVQLAVAAAQKALKTFSKTSKEQRIQYLEQLRDAVAARSTDLVNVMVQEYGGTHQFCSMIIQFAIDDFNAMIEVVRAEITRNPGIAKVSFTGSTQVGKIIAKGAVDSMKRVTLELGGKSPNVILDDAVLEEAIPTAVIAAFLNSGQACAAATRLLVPAAQLETVNNIVKATVANMKVGNPAEPDTAIGPMVSTKQFERVQDYIRIGQEEGATLLIGGNGKPAGLEAGNYTKATVFTNVKNSMRIAQEEIFGPVLSIIPYKDEAEAIEIANDTIYGLAAYVASSNEERAQNVASQIDAGRICINGLSHDSKAPFGGFKQSGIGREYGIFGLEEYLEPKAILK